MRQVSPAMGALPTSAYTGTALGRRRAKWRQIPDTMRAVDRRGKRRAGGPEGRPAADPQAGGGRNPGQVAAAGVNRPDVLQRKGAYPPPPGASGHPGPGDRRRGGGRWAKAHALAVGDRVCALVPGGGYAEYCVVHESERAAASPPASP